MPFAEFHFSIALLPPGPGITIGTEITADTVQAHES